MDPPSPPAPFQGAPLASSLPHAQTALLPLPPQQDYHQSLASPEPQVFIPLTPTGTVAPAWVSGGISVATRYVQVGQPQAGQVQVGQSQLGVFEGAVWAPSGSGSSGMASVVQGEPQPANGINSTVSGISSNTSAGNWANTTLFRLSSSMTMSSNSSGGSNSLLPPCSEWPPSRSAGYIPLTAPAGNTCPGGSSPLAQRTMSIGASAMQQPADASAAADMLQTLIFEAEASRLAADAASMAAMRADNAASRFMALTLANPDMLTSQQAPAGQPPQLMHLQGAQQAPACQPVQLMQLQSLQQAPQCQQPQLVEVQGAQASIACQQPQLMQLQGMQQAPAGQQPQLMQLQGVQASIAGGRPQLMQLQGAHPAPTGQQSQLVQLQSAQPTPACQPMQMMQLQGPQLSPAGQTPQLMQLQSAQQQVHMVPRQGAPLGGMILGQLDPMSPSMGQMPLAMTSPVAQAPGQVAWGGPAPSPSVTRPMGLP